MWRISPTRVARRRPNAKRRPPAVGPPSPPFRAGPGGVTGAILGRTHGNYWTPLVSGNGDHSSGSRPATRAGREDDTSVPGRWLSVVAVLGRRCKRRPSTATTLARPFWEEFYGRTDRSPLSPYTTRSADVTTLVQRPPNALTKESSCKGKQQ